MSRTGAKSLLLLALNLVVTVLFLACGNTIVPIKDPDACKLQVVDMTILASPRINVTDRGEARPVQVRVYQLASDTRLNNVDFQEMWKDDKKALGEDLIKVQEFPVYPDSRTDVRFERDTKALFVAVMAIFRSPKGRSWYTLFELPPAPGNGNCYAKLCKDGLCEDAGPQLNPKFSVWIDGSRVDEGSDKLENYPKPGRAQHIGEMPESPGLSPGAPTATARERPAGPGTPEMPTVPTVPTGPTLPTAPSAPSAPAVPSAPSAPTAPAPPGGAK